MGVMAATYVGPMMGDTNMSYWGDQWAAEAVANFNLYGTLAEVRIYGPFATRIQSNSGGSSTVGRIQA